MIANSTSFRSEPSVLKFPSLLEQEIEQAGRITVRSYYESVLLPELAHQAKTSLKEDATAMKHWENLTGNPDIRELEKTHLFAFRDGMLSEEKSPATINKNWREIKAILEAAKEDDLINRVPQIARRMKCRLMEEPSKNQREPLTESELTRLWRACKYATYPSGGQFPAPMLWRTAIAMWWTYGQRTRDLLDMDHKQVWWTQLLIRFEAQKTGKLQGLPIAPIIAQHLRSLKGHSSRIFPGFTTAGFLDENGLIAKRGYYATWNAEICRNARLEGLQIKHLRERAVTYYNGIEPGLGAWIAGHSVPGVTAQNYDLPTKRIRDAVCSAPVPKCFYEIG